VIPAGFLFPGKSCPEKGHKFKLPPKWRRKKAEKEKCFAAFAGGGGRVMGGGYEVLMLM
jgi:hypothetical protein